MRLKEGGKSEEGKLWGGFINGQSLTESHVELAARWSRPMAKLAHPWISITGRVTLSLCNSATHSPS